MNKSIFKVCQSIINERLPQIKYFGLFRNQFFNSLKDREIPFPAILLEIKPINFRQLPGFNQEASVIITLHIGIQVVNNIENGDKMVDNSLDLLSLVDLINESFTGSIGEDFLNQLEDHVYIGNFTRIGQDQILNLKSLIITKLSYTFPIWLKPIEYTYPITISGATITFSGTTI